MFKTMPNIRFIPDVSGSMGNNPSGLLNRLSGSYSQESWGNLREKDLNMSELMQLNELCNRASSDRVDYLVTLYNYRDSSLSRVEAHFVAHYAERRGYHKVGTGDDAKFEK